MRLKWRKTKEFSLKEKGDMVEEARVIEEKTGKDAQMIGMIREIERIIELVIENTQMKHIEVQGEIIEEMNPIVELRGTTITIRIRTSIGRMLERELSRLLFNICLKE
jgi:hypothetical protein